MTAYFDYAAILGLLCILRSGTLDNGGDNQAEPLGIIRWTLHSRYSRFCEDVKEYYFYLDSTPTHSYMRYLYKYHQGEFPYVDLVETNRRRSRHELEYELLDTGIFDVFVEYAKDAPGRCVDPHHSAQSRPSPDSVVSQHLGQGRYIDKPSVRLVGPNSIAASDEATGDYTFVCDGGVDSLFTTVVVMPCTTAVRGAFNVN